MAQTFTVEQAQNAHIRVLEDPALASQAVHDTVVALQANRRSGTACAKTRAELHKPDKKPWRQKGTGRARSGSVNSPVWVGGGVVFGPRPRDYSKKVNRKVKRLAFAAAISARIQAGEVVYVNDFTVADGKTKSFVQQISAASDKPKVLVVAGAFDEKTLQAARNHSTSLLMVASDITVEQVLNYHKIIITSDALPVLAQRTAQA
jgi:large subunit ribosomal protein L4